jgi:hypothetical protein
MRKARVGGIAAAALMAATGIALLAAAPANAYVENGCHARFAGVRLDGVPADGAHAIAVGKDDIVPMTMSGTGKKFTELHIYFTVAGADVDLYDAPAGGGTWSHNVDIHSFARFGVGYYWLQGVGDFADGTSCSGDVMIKVTGDPLGTVAGDVGLGTTVAGVLGMLGAGASNIGSGGGGGTGTGGAVTQSDVAKEEEHQRDLQNLPADYSPDDAAEDASHGWCFLFGVLAVLVLPLLLVFGSSAALMAVAAPVTARVKRRNWPLVLGAFSGLLTGFGAGVLLQQYAIAYPSRTMTIVYLGGGILFGLSIPLLRRALSR